MSDDRGDGSPWPIAVFFLVVVVSGLTWLLTGTHYYDAKQKEAVKEGHAVWVAREDGKAEFKWLPACKPQSNPQPKAEDQPKERKP